MRQKAILALTVVGLFLLIGCSGGSHGTPASPGNVFKYTLSTTLTNQTGAATIVDAQILIDNVVVGDSCPPADEQPDQNNDGGSSCSAPPLPSVQIAATGTIGSGAHTLVMLLSSISNQSFLNSYQLAAIAIPIRDASGKVTETITIPSQTATLGPGNNGGPRTITVQFTV
jgi:hypothetical protein